MNTHFCVYVLECQGFYKIGKTSDLKWRVTNLQAANPSPIEVAHVLFTDRYAAVELALHRIFAKKRHRGEWFALDQEDLTAIRNWTVEDILALEPTAGETILTHPQVSEPWPRQWNTITLPEEFIAPMKILLQAVDSEKSRKLFGSFVLIFNLAWESDYRCTPALYEVEVMQYLKLSRRQYFDHKSEIQKLGWFQSHHPDPGTVIFTFEEALLVGSEVSES